MAITNAIPELWSARVLAGFDRQTIWEGLVSDLSGELTEGNKLNLSSVTTAVLVKDYQRNMDIDAPQRIDDAKEVLELNREKYFNIAVDDVDAVQMKPALFDEFSRKAGVATAQQADADIMAEVIAGLPAAQINATGPAFPDDSPDKAKREAFIELVLTQKDAMDAAELPEEGRWVVFNRAVYNQLVRYLVFDRNIGTGALEDVAWQRAALGNLFGLTVRKDNSLPIAASAGRVHAVLGIPEATVFARQIAKIEPYRIEAQFGDAVKGLFVYGTERVYDTGIWTLAQKA